MAKIFISYKYRDSDVFPLGGDAGTTARQYVDALVPHLEEIDHIFKGEEDDEDLSHLSEERIAQLLFDRIYDSTVTIVLISKNMKEVGVREKDQWIPREVSYSLTENNRGGRVSHTNAMLGIVLPDRNGHYDYFVENVALHCPTIRWKTETLFPVLGRNMFNREDKKVEKCPSGICGERHIDNDHSYIFPVRWSDFVLNPRYYINHSIQIKENLDEYNLTKVLDLV